MGSVAELDRPAQPRIEGVADAVAEHHPKAPPLQHLHSTLKPRLMDGPGRGHHTHDVPRPDPGRLTERRNGQTAPR